MITVRVQGGLGNQMFIYAAGRSWALANNTDLALDAVNGGYGPEETFGRSFKLPEYQIVAQTADPKTVARYNPSTRSFYWRKKLNSLLPINLRSLIVEPRRYDSRLPHANLRKDCYLTGYWQREDYFRKYCREIRHELQLKKDPGSATQLLATRMRQCASVSIHVRRHNYGFKLQPDYYQHALAAVNSCVVNPRFFVFGDDLSWAKSNLRLPDEACYFDGEKARSDVEDLWLMSQCEHAIVANSSFSWWAAWLGTTDGNKLVIAPKNWGYGCSAPSAWRQIENTLDIDKRFI